MRTTRSHIPVPPSARPGVGRKLFWLGFISLLGLGVLYVFVSIQVMMLKASFSEALTNDVIDTIQFEKVTRAGVRQKLQQAVQKLKMGRQKMSMYISLQKKEEFAGLGDYYLRTKIHGYTSAQKHRTKKIPGCNIRDALPPDTTMRDLAGGGTHGGSISTRVEGIVGRDARAVVTGKRSSGMAPANTVILAVDVLLTYKMAIFKHKLWFHRRCFFYEKRRAYEPSQQHTQFVK